MALHLHQVPLKTEPAYSSVWPSAAMAVPCSAECGEGCVAVLLCGTAENVYIKVQLSASMENST
jgi:hypothetical protein